MRNAKRFVTKLILGLATAGLLFYFGYSGFNKNSMQGIGGARTIATVNRKPISALKFEQIYDNQVKYYEQLTKNKLPPQLLASLKQNVLERLITNELFAEQAIAAGLLVSDQELAKEITSNPSFYKDGMFDKKLYLLNKDYYFRQSGEDYEESLRKDLLVEKFEKFIKDSVDLTDEEVKQEYLLANTQLNLQKVIVDQKILNEKTETKPTETKPIVNKRQTIETEILKAVEAKGDLKKSLATFKAKYDLKIEESGFRPLREKAALVGDPNAKEAIECVLKLNTTHPFCSKGYLIGNQLVFFKLIERKDPDWTKYEQEKAALAKTLLERRQTLTVHQVQKALLQEAKIDLYSNNAQ